MVGWLAVVGCMATHSVSASAWLHSRWLGGWWLAWLVGGGGGGLSKVGRLVGWLVGRLIDRSTCRSVLPLLLALRFRRVHTRSISSSSSSSGSLSWTHTSVLVLWSFACFADLIGFSAGHGFEDQCTELLFPEPYPRLHGFGYTNDSSVGCAFHDWSIVDKV